MQEPPERRTPLTLVGSAGGARCASGRTCARCRRRTLRAEADISAAKREAFPDISLGVGYTHSNFTVSGDNPNSLALTLSLPLPIFDRNQAGIGRARLSLKRAENDAAKIQISVEHDVADAVRRTQRAQALVQVFEGGMIDRAETALKVAEKSYKAGAVSLLELLEAQRTYIETRAQYLRARHDWQPGFDRRDARGRRRAVKRAAVELCCLSCSLSACSGNGAAPAQSAERSRDFIRLDPGSPHLDFVKIEVVKESEAAPLVQLTGRITFDEDRTQRVASPIDGRATQLLVRPGDKVRAGQALVALSSPQVGALQADAQKAQSDLSVAQKNADRAHTLKGDGAISEKELAQAEADLRKAKADVARTSAQLKSLGVSATEPATNVALYAQVSGTVVERNVLVGQEVRADAAQPLLTITNLDTVWVMADVYEQDLGLVQEGAAMVLRVPAYPGVDFKGKVGHIGDLVDPATRTVKIRCVAPNPKGQLKPEMFAKVELEDTSGRKVITIPAKVGGD